MGGNAECIFIASRDNQTSLYPRDEEAAGPIQDTRASERSRLMYSRHGAARLRSFFPFHPAATRVIRQLAGKKFAFITQIPSGWLFCCGSHLLLRHDTCASANCYPFVYTRLIEPARRELSLSLSRSLHVRARVPSRVSNLARTRAESIRVRGPSRLVTR